MRVPDAMLKEAFGLLHALRVAMDAEREGREALATYPPWAAEERHGAEANVACLASFREETEAACNATMAAFAKIDACTTQEEFDAICRDLNAAVDEHRERIEALGAFGSFMDPDPPEEGTVP